VEEARTIEGDSGEEEEGGGEAEGEGRRSRRRSGGGLRPVSAAEQLNEKEEWWRPLEAELFAVFSHWSSLSGSFSNVSASTLTRRFCFFPSFASLSSLLSLHLREHELIFFGGVFSSVIRAWNPPSSIQEST